MAHSKFVEDLAIFPEIGIKGSNLSDLVAGIQILRYMSQIWIGVKARLFVIFIQL